MAPEGPGRMHGLIMMMDGWKLMDGLIDIWMDGRIDGWKERSTAGWKDRSMESEG